MSLPPEIPRQLSLLRRRVRRVQWVRGVLRLLAVLLAGLLIMVALDVVFAPLAQSVRVTLFFGWLGVLGWSVFTSLIRPLGRRVTDVQLARWLEGRHPEVEERISTALELSDSEEGVSKVLLEKLQEAAVGDVSSFDPVTEVSSQRARQALWLVMTLVVTTVGLVTVFPREMSRLLTRAVAPFSKTGNAGGFRFTVEPGNLEVLEGDQVVIQLTYEGEVDGEVSLFTKRVGGDLLSEELLPVTEEEGVHQFRYQLNGAQESFEYFARVGRDESDHFEVMVYPLPRLKQATVRYRYPDYTGWQDRVVELSGGVNVLAGTEILVKSRVPIEVEKGQFFVNDKVQFELAPKKSASGAGLEWSFQMTTPGSYRGRVILDHRLRDDLVASEFPIEVVEDKAPTVELVDPTQREFRLRPDDQIQLHYEVQEQIGLSSADLEVEWEGKRETLSAGDLPRRMTGEQNQQWHGETTVYLANLLKQHQGVHEFRLRLKLSDNRPATLKGPGVGYSDWLVVRLDDHAPSLARQELRAQQEDLQKTLREALNETQRAQEEIRHTKSHLSKDTFPEWVPEKLVKARNQLAETEKKLEKLAERMRKSVQAHRTDELLAATAKLAEARRNVEYVPLQDTVEARQSEVQSALQNTKDAIQQLKKLSDEARRDQSQIEDLARLQELAQKQEALAREAQDQSEQDARWQQHQKGVSNELREMVEHSPQAKAAAAMMQADEATKLAREASKLAQSQEDLKELTEASQESASQNLAAALKNEQAALTEDMVQELAKARLQNEERANTLPEAVAQAEKARDGEKLKEVAQSAQKASEALKEGRAPSQQSLQSRQEELAKAFEALAAGNSEAALTGLEKIQAERATEFSEELQSLPQVSELSKAFAEAKDQGQRGAQHARQAMDEQAQGHSEKAAHAHAEAADQLQQASGQLTQASEALREQSQKLSQQEHDGRRAPAPGQELAEAFQESAKASQAKSSEQAGESAQAAADALKSAVQQAKTAMQHNQQPGKAGENLARNDGLQEHADPTEQPEGPGSQEGQPEEQAAPGVPPELARLGVSASDWEKIKATLQSDVGGANGSVIPEDYRGLVKKYFEQVTQNR